MTQAELFELARLLNRLGAEVELEKEEAEVITAIPLDNEDKLMLAQRLTEIFGKPIVLKPKVDPSIIGGIIIRIGDKLIDGSIRSKLEALKRELMKAER